jgi:hypothetical protein
MKKEKKYFIADFYKTPEEIQARKNQIDENMASVLKTIKAGKIYAQIASVSRSGMSRRILFFRVNYGGIERITSEVAWLYGAVTPGQYKQGGKYLTEDGLQVNGCGMDMIFHTLYSCMPYGKAKNWSQKYSTL